MNTKIPLRLLADRMAAKTDLSSDLAQTFTKALFQHVADALYSGEEVAVEGLGTFLTANDINNPILFSPCDELLDELNAPFALFSPVEIHNAESLDSLNEVDAEFHAAEEVETVEDFDHVSSGPEECDSTADEKIEETIESSIKPSEVLPPPLPDEIEKRDNIVAEEQGLDDVSNASEVTIAAEKIDHDPKAVTGSDIRSYDNILISEANDTSDTPEDVVSNEAEDFTEVDGPAEDAESAELPNPAESEVNTLEDEVDKVDESPQVFDSVDKISEDNMTFVDLQPTIIPESEEQTHDYYVRKSSRFGLGFVMGLIVGLLIGALALACYAIYFVNTGISLL